MSHSSPESSPASSAESGSTAGQTTPNTASTQTKPVREIRINPVLPSESVLIATARGMRPKKPEKPVERDTRHLVADCPFCPGNEQKTPPANSTWRNDDTEAKGEVVGVEVKGEQPDWRIRIVENLYPMLGEDDNDQAVQFGLQQTIEGYGRHEVIIDHANHGVTVSEMSQRHIALLFTAYQSRMRELYASDSRLAYVLVFKNYGKASGSSIPHTHSQLVATPVVPSNVQQELIQSQQFYERNRRCVFCALIDEALSFEATIYDRDSGECRRRIDVGQYLVERGEHFVAIKPFASRYEWEVQILPLQHQADFLNTSPELIQDFAGVLQRTMQRLDAVIGNVQYNYFIHSVPVAADHYAASYHWHLEITPRTSIPTGFELGSGFYVNTLSPENAARRLREVVL